MALTNNHYRVIGVCKYFGLSWFQAFVVLAQAMYESNNFQSNVFAKNNNAFGMKMLTKRKSPFISGAGTKPPSNEGATPYAKYASLEMSVADVIHRHTYFKINWSSIASTNDFVSWLASTGYFGYTPAASAVNIYKAGMQARYNQITTSGTDYNKVPEIKVEAKTTAMQTAIDWLKKKWYVPLAAGLLILYWINPFKKSKRKGGY